MRPFDYVSPSTIDEALTLLAPEKGSETRALAGGTDLLTLIKGDIERPARVVDIKRLRDLDARITRDEHGITLGALATLGQIESDPIILQAAPVLAEAAAVAATPQLRNMATIGGNLLQKPRDWYYRNGDIDEWRKGGEATPAIAGQNQHHGIFGENGRSGVHPSDLAPALTALDAVVQTQSSRGSRMLPIGEFFVQPTDEHRSETVLEQDELITRIVVPEPGVASRSGYTKAMERKAWAFALVSVAASVSVDGDTVTDARLVLGGVATIPWRVQAAEQVLVGNALIPEVIAQAADVALEGAKPLSHNGYKVELAKAIIRQTLTRLASG